MVAKLNNSLDLCKTNKLTPIIQNWITGVKNRQLYLKNSLQFSGAVIPSTR